MAFIAFISCDKLAKWFEDLVDNTDKILVEFNRQSLALPKVKYTVCLSEDVNNDKLMKKLAIATVSAFAIGKKD